ncbi:MAG: hypothetical protein LBU37_07850 [Tannerellaceae bacterium]|jgi:hypothetical protein|nr:hypothetical protein [Tannerellaceae bacterium]
MIETLKKCIILAALLYSGQAKGNTSVQERVYLQTDKELYLAGELLWLKLYTTDAEGRLFSFSKTGYIELVNDSIPEVQIKVDITDGTGAGWIELPALLPAGYYRLIAYTRYMRKAEVPVFFEKRIGIINPFHSDNRSQPYDDSATIPSHTIMARSNPVRISTDKAQYKKRAKGEIHLTGLPHEYISLGISIAGVEPETYRSFNDNMESWKNKLAGIPSSANYSLPEYEGAIIEGKLIDIKTEEQRSPENVIKLLSFPGEPIHIYNGKQDSDGKITFFTQYATGKREISTTAIDPSGKRYRIDIESPYINHTGKPLPPIVTDSNWTGYLKSRALGLQVINAYAADSLNAIRSVALPTHFVPDRSYVLDNYTRFPVMEELFIEFILAVQMRKVNGKRTFFAMTKEMKYTNGNTLVLFDNIPVTDHEQMYSYNPLLIKKIDVYFGRYVFGGQPFDGILSFSSYKNDYPSITFPETTQLFDYEGTQPYRYFYAPSYETDAETNSRMPDFRHTLLWEPTLQSNGEETLTIPFRTSDIPGAYRITVEGISEEGSIIHETYTFKVNE